MVWVFFSWKTDLLMSNSWKSGQISSRKEVLMQILARKLEFSSRGIARGLLFHEENMGCLLRLNFLVEKASWGPRGSPHKKSGQVIFPVKKIPHAKPHDHEESNFKVPRGRSLMRTSCPMSSSWKSGPISSWKKKLHIINLMRNQVPRGNSLMRSLVEKSISSWGPHEKVGQFPREKQFLMRKLMRNWNPHGDTYEERKFLTKILMRNGVYSSLFRGKASGGTLNKSAGNPRCAVPAESHSICTDRRRPGPASVPHLRYLSVSRHFNE